MKGVMYLSMSILSAQLGRLNVSDGAATSGCCISSASFSISSWSAEVWKLVLLQGVLATCGDAMLCVPTTLLAGRLVPCWVPSDGVWSAVFDQEYYRSRRAVPVSSIFGGCSTAWASKLPNASRGRTIQ